MYHPENFPVWDLSICLTSRADIICYGQDRILNFIDVIFDEDTNAPNTFYLPNFDQPFLAEINGSKQATLSLTLPWVTKTRFLLTVSMQYHAGKW